MTSIKPNAPKRAQPTKVHILFVIRSFCSKRLRIVSVRVMQADIILTSSFPRRWNCVFTWKRSGWRQRWNCWSTERKVRGTPPFAAATWWDSRLAAFGTFREPCRFPAAASSPALLRPIATCLSVATHSNTINSLLTIKKSEECATCKSETYSVQTLLQCRQNDQLRFVVVSLRFGAIYLLHTQKKIHCQ